MCVKDYGLHNQSIDIINLFPCLVGYLIFSHLEIQKNKGTIFKNLLGLV